MNSFLLPYSLKNKKAFRIAHGVRTHTETLIVQIEKGGISGLGEAAHVPYYGIDRNDSMALIQDKWDKIYPIFGQSPNEFWDCLHMHLGENHFAICALDIAHQDWWAKKNGKSLSQNLGIDNSMTPLSSYTIGIDSVEEMLSSMAEIDFPYLKIKLGSEDDLGLITALRKHTDKPMRIDVNAGWDLAYAQRMLNKIGELGNFELLEQPLAIKNIEENVFLKERGLTPIFVDESCVSKEDVKKVAPYVDGINIKLTKCGGVTPALEMIKEARALGLKLMMGCMMETSIGISALAHLSALVDFIDMDGSSMISNDPAEGVQIVKGKAIFNQRNGHGALLKDGIDQEGIITL